MSDQERIDRYAEALFGISEMLTSSLREDIARAAIAVADAEQAALRAENAMLREGRATEQRALRAALPIIAAATEGPRLWVEPDGFGEPTIWHEIAGAPQPVLAKSDLCVGSRHLWETVAARLTAGSAT